MSRSPSYIVLAVIIVATALMTGWVMRPASVASVVKPDALERVVESKILRCGYISYPPYFSKDPNTGVASGFMVDVMQSIAQKMNVKLEWNYETTWATALQDVQMGRFDAVCSSIWQNTPRALQADFSQPIVYAPLEAWVRADDARFDGNIEAINNPNVTLSLIDGEAGEKVADDVFPNAKRFSTPQNAMFSEVINAVVTHKADVVFLEPKVAEGYLASNPETIRKVANVAPVMQFAVTILLPPNAPRLKTVIDTALYELRMTPKLSQLVAKNGLADSVRF